MELKEYIRIIRHRGWIVLLLAVLVAGAGYGFGKMQPTIYQASVRLSVRPVRADWGLGQAVGNLLRSLAGDITTHSFMQEIIDRQQLDTTTDALLDGRTVFVTDEAADFTVTISVRDPYEKVAVNVANAIADLFMEKQDEWNDLQDKRDRIDVQIRDYARYAEVYSPKPKLIAAGGGVLGALLGTLIVFVLEWLEAGVVRRAEDLDRLSIPVMGSIPAESGWLR